MKKPSNLFKRFLLMTMCTFIIFSMCFTFAASQHNDIVSEIQSLSMPPEFTPTTNKINNVNIISDTKFDFSNILMTKLQSSESKNAKGTRNGTVLVLVNSVIFKDIKSSINTYTSDLAAEGYSTKVYTVSGKDPVQLKSFLRSCWLEILNEYLQGKMSVNALSYGTGAFFVGDLPVPLVHMRTGEYTDENGVKKPYEGTMVCDLYLNDMDGNWNYADENGIPFLSTVDPSIISADSECTPSDFCSPKWIPYYKGGKGSAKPEIWSGRLAVSPMAIVNGTYQKSVEIKLMKEYFERNHAYRHGYYPYVPKNESGVKYAARDRLVYYDDPWSDIASNVANSCKQTWGGSIVHDNNYTSVPTTRYVNTESITSNNDYLNRLSNNNLWIDILAHSNPWYHEFVKWAYNYDNWKWEWQDVGWISTDDLSKKTMNALFYNIEGCDACDYRQERYLGGRYLYTGKALAVIGNTTVGPQDSGTLYKALGENANIGLAFMLNQKAFGTDGWVTNMVSSYDNFDAKRYYGQTLLGDPTLKPIAFIPKSQPYSIGHEVTDYTKLIPILKNLKLNDNSKYLLDLVKKKIDSESRNKIKKISKVPEKGFEYLKLDVNKIIRDPQFNRYINLDIIASKFTYGLTMKPNTPSALVGSSVQLNGLLTMKANNNQTAIPLQGKEIEIYEIVKRGTMVVSTTLVTKATTVSTGAYQVKVTPTEGIHIYKAVYKNSTNKELATSDEATIKVIKIIITPRIPR